MNVGIKLDELARAAESAVHAEARRRGDARGFAPFGRSRLSVSLVRAASSFMKTSCAVRSRMLTLLVADQSARVAVEQRHRKFLFERAHLA